MVKLNGGDIFKEIFPDRGERKNTFGHQPPAHQGESVEGITGLESGDKTTGKNRNKDKQRE